MKVKLIKTVDGYELFTQGFLKDSINHGLIESLNIEEGPIRYKLSLKNCQAIELGYDLDELAKEECEYNQDSLRQYDSKFIEFYKEGFQKALEILGDKKFSEEDVIKAIEIARNGSMQEQHNGYGRPTESRFVLDNLPSDEIIQSLQQTEWDVEILCLHTGNPKYTTNTGLPKLDEDGCLILKRL
jgi:hypothetical protein